MSKPSYQARVLALAKTGIWFIVIYNFTNWLSAQRSSVPTAAFEWELSIPLVPFFIIPYWSIDLFFIAAPFVIRDSEQLHLFVRRVIWSISIAGICFIVYPLQLAFIRPEVEGILGIFFSSLYSFDKVYNLAPSLHIALRTILWSVYGPVTTGLWNLLLRAWFVLVGISTVLVWQHQIVDVFFGNILGCLIVHLIRPSESHHYPNPDPNVRQNSDIRIGIRYAGLSALLLLGWAWLGFVGFVLAWPAVSFALVAGAYFGLGPRIFGPNNGCSRFLFAPYRFCSRVWQRRYFDEASRWISAADDVCFGRLPTLEEQKQIFEQGVRTIVIAAPEYAPLSKLPGMRIIEVPILDLTLPEVAQLEEASLLIEKQRMHGKVAVVCALGLGRSALLTASWLLYSGRAGSGEEALLKLRGLNPRVVLGSRESELLQRMRGEYEGSRKGDASRRREEAAQKPEFVVE